MAGIKPFFLTGANAKIKVNGKTLAFATSVSYRIEVKHEDPRILGMYEGHSLEPVAYRVSGSFSVIRYVAEALTPAVAAGPGHKSVKVPVLEDDKNSPNFGQPKKDGNGNVIMKNVIRPATVPAKPIPGVSSSGNGIGAVGDNSFKGAIGMRPSPREFFNPKLMDRHSGFEIEIHQKIGNESIPVARIRGVKLTMADFSLDKKNAAAQNFTFEALYVDEDSFLADFSGRGQQFQ